MGTTRYYFSGLGSLTPPRVTSSAPWTRDAYAAYGGSAERGALVTSLDGVLGGVGGAMDTNNNPPDEQVRIHYSVGPALTAATTFTGTLRAACRFQWNGTTYTPRLVLRVVSSTGVSKATLADVVGAQITASGHHVRTFTGPITPYAAAVGDRLVIEAGPYKTTTATYWGAGFRGASGAGPRFAYPYGDAALLDANETGNSWFEVIVPETPPAPTGLTAVPAADSVALTWDSPSSPPADYSLWDRGTAHMQANALGGIYSMGTEFKVASAASAKALRYFHPAGMTGAVQGALYRVSDQAKVTPTMTFAAGVAGTWNEVALPAEVPLTPGVAYKMVCYYAGGYPSSTGNVWTAAGRTSGPLSAPRVADAAGGAQATFINVFDGVIAYPTNSGAGTDYGVDVVVTAAAAAPTITGYAVSVDGAPAVPVGLVTTYTVTGLTPDTAYTFAVTALNGDVSSAPASAVATTLAPAAPAGLEGLRLEVGGEGAAVDVLGDAYTLTIRRGTTARGVTDDLEAGTLLAVVDGPSANPLTVPQVRPGARVRVLAGIADGLGTTTWEPLFTGTLDRARLTYAEGADKAAAGAYRVTLTATDAVPALAAAPHATAIGGTLTQRVAHVLDPTGLPWSANDTAAPLPTPALDTNERTAAGGLRLAVDTAHALAYVDRRNVIQIVADNTRPRAVTTADHVATDDPAAPAAAWHYYAITPTLDTAALVNVLDVNLLDGGETDTSTHTDETSRAEWGDQRGEVTVNDGVPESHADLWLASRRDPALLPERLSLNVRARLSHLAVATLEPYDTIEVARAGVLPAPVVLAVRDLEHVLTADRRRADGIGWRLHIGLRPLETLATRWDDVPPALTWDALPAGLTWDDAVRWHPYL